MANEGYEKELFEFDEKPRKGLPRFEKMLPKADFEGKVNITLGLDRIIFISMGVILAMVVIFAVGVERGRSIERASLETIKVEAAQVAQVVVPVTAPAPAAVTPVTGKASPAISVKTTQGVSPKSTPVGMPPVVAPLKQAVALPRKAETKDDAGSKPYTIVAASFKGKDAAIAAVASLKKESIASTLVQNDPYFVVCVGNYISRDAAQAMFTKVKKTFKDAYIKLR